LGGFKNFGKRFKSQRTHEPQIQSFTWGLIADEFWDFLGGKGTCKDLLDCFERVGIELRDEIDSYFKKFNHK
jgi:hypothetical protein